MAKLKRAEQLIEQGKYTEARELIVELLHNDYNNLEAWQMLLVCARDRQEYSRALREILRIDPANAEARRLAIELARENSEDNAAAPSRPAPRRRSPVGGLMRAFANILAFLLVVGIAGGVAYAYLQWRAEDDETPPTVVPTLDAVAQCEASVPTVYERVNARCPIVATGAVCLVNPGVAIESNTGQTDLLTLAGDETLISNLKALNAAPYNPADVSWGLVQLRGEADSANGLMILATAGTNMRFFDEQLNQISFSIGDNLGCEPLPPPGLILHTQANDNAMIEINGETFLIGGTLFLQVDVNGLRGIVLDGQIRLEERDTLVRKGQWFQLSVDPSLLALETAVPQVSDTTPQGFSGNLLNLVPLGETFRLGTWTITGLSDEPGTPPLATAGPPATRMEIPTADTLPTDTPLPSDMMTPSQTGADASTQDTDPSETPVPPDMVTPTTSEAE